MLTHDSGDCIIIQAPDQDNDDEYGNNEDNNHPEEAPIHQAVHQVNEDGPNENVAINNEDDIEMQPEEGNQKRNTHEWRTPTRRRRFLS